MKYDFDDLVDAAKAVQRKRTDKSKLSALTELYFHMNMAAEELKKAKKDLARKSAILQSAEEILKGVATPIIDKDPGKKICMDVDADIGKMVLSMTIESNPPRVEVLVDPKDLPDEYRRVKYEADKIALKKGITAGKVSPELAKIITSNTHVRFSLGML